VTLFPSQPASLVELLAQRAAEKPAAKAFVFVPERGPHIHLTFSELHRRAHALAVRLTRQTVPGDRAVFLFPPGLDFVVALFGCLAACVIAVPLMVPRRTAARDSSTEVIADCTPRIAMTTAGLLEGRPDVADRLLASGLDWMTVNAMDDAPDEPDAVLPHANRDSLAFLQYTSGSTSTPKGVMVAHDNLLVNLEMLRIGMGNTGQSASVGWVPLYHDMGLMMGVMQPLYLGATSVLMAPAAFMQRPLTWLHIIHQYRAEVTSAPNFAFDLCVDRFSADHMEDVDLSCWKVALNAAEPLHADTIARFTETFAPYGFSPGTMYPGYGLAEATLLVTGSSRGEAPVTRTVSRPALQEGEVASATERDAQPVVSCGQTLVGQRVAIVDPATGRRVAPNRVGEVWVNGPNVARGYWRNQPVTNETFHAHIADEPTCDWLRTGDLGFQDENGELFITGRIKDLIIIRGMNHYPQDIERTVQDCHPGLRRDWGAAFAITDQDGNEQLTVVQEVERTYRKNLDCNEIASRIREAIARQHEIAVHAIALIPPATLPKTTSGKVQRSLAKKLWLEGALEVLG
jgi:acyl-CoA synthetase (AMP-forming)/AMP-acid ligase II